MNEEKKPFGNSFFEKNPNAENDTAEKATGSFSEKPNAGSNQLSVPQITLPKGGGALRGIDEKFSVNAANGTSAFSIPLPISPGRNGFQRALVISYNSGASNSIFGLSWNVDFPSIQRKKDKQLLRYFDAEESGVFMFSGAEGLVTEFKKDSNGEFIIKADGTFEFNEFASNDGKFEIKRYRSRIEGLFTPIEKISSKVELLFTGRSQR